MKLVILAGKKLTEEGEVNPLFADCLMRAYQLFDSGKGHVLLISGGKTRKEFDSEALVGLRYLQKHYNRKLPAILEEDSRSTSENARFTKRTIDGAKMEGAYFSGGYVISGKAHIPRVKYFFKYFWPEMFPQLIFEGVEDDASYLDHLKELILLVIAWLDPQEQYILPPLKKFFRNA